MRYSMILLLALVATAPALVNAQQCSLQTLHASYAFYYKSGPLSAPAAGGGVGLVSFDGAGKGISKESVNTPFGVMHWVESNVAYTVNPDCTGTITWTYPSFGDMVVKGDIVISDNGKSMYVVGTDPGNLSIGVYSRQ